MGIFSEESLNKLRQRIDLAEVLSKHIDLKRSGGAYKALCPFHDEKTPSFIINKGDSHYHCFGCGAHGDAIAFLMSYMKMSFSEAVESLAERFGIQLEKKEIEGEKRGPDKTRLKEILSQAKRFYHFYLLHSHEGRAALEYLFKRGIDLEFIQMFEIGFAPKKSGLLTSFLKEHSFQQPLIELCGLTQIDKGINPREFFSNRVMFPIKDPLGHVVGFSARKIYEETFGPKYINTPETPLFKKSHLLYGLSECRKRIAKERKVILVEGQIDTLRLIQEGFDLTVAGQGTAFTVEHAAELIKLGVQEVYIAFDGDEAGRQAAIKVGDFFQKEGIEVKVVSFDEKQDPDLLLREKGPQTFARLLEEAKEYLAFLVQEGAKNFDLQTPSGKHQLVEVIKKRIHSWHHPLMIHESLKKLASLMKIPEHLLQQEVIHEEVFIRKQESINKQEIDPQRILESDFLRWILLYGQKDQIMKISFINVTSKDLKVPICRNLFEIMVTLYQEGKMCDLLTLGMKLESVEEQLFLSEILQKRVNGEKALEGCRLTIQKILERNWLLEREAIKIKIHSGRCSDEQVYELAKRFDDLKKTPPQLKFPEDEKNSNSC